MKIVYEKLQKQYGSYRTNDGGLTMAACDCLDELSRLKEKYPTRDAFEKYVAAEEYLTPVESDVLYWIHVLDEDGEI